MAISIDEVVRRLVLLGIPILPGGCDWFLQSTSSCPGPAPPPHAEVAEIVRPAADGGTSSVTEAAFASCVDTGDCLALCQQHFRFGSVQSCERIADDAGVSQKGGIFVRAQVVTICEGRRPQGYRPARGGQARCQVGAWLADAAHTEALSVPAFDRLARELTAHAAPAPLVRAAQRSSREERRHTRMMTSLSRRHGVSAPPPSLRIPGHVRSLEAVAIENAVEGCVRETTGALLARWQSHWAGDAQIRAAMTVIARDEAKHAELAWQIDGWATSRLRPAARVRVETARDKAVAALESEIAQTRPGPELQRAAGMPSATAALALVRAARPLLWPTRPA